MKNAVYILSPYRTRAGVWAFDDARFGLKCEPFVGDTNVVINTLLEAKGIKADTFCMTFSRYALPDFDAKFTLREVNDKSAWYWCDRS